MYNAKLLNILSILQFFFKDWNTDIVNLYSEQISKYEFIYFNSNEYH